MIPPRYPNPDRVVYPRGYPPAYPCQLTTRDAARMYPLHNHGAWTDDQGNGNTDVDAGHFHRIRNFKILPDESDGHTHEISNLPCGAGAPHDLVRQSDDTWVNASPPSRALMQGAASGGGMSVWPVVIGAVVGIGLLVAGVLLYKHGHESAE